MHPSHRYIHTQERFIHHIFQLPLAWYIMLSRHVHIITTSMSVIVYMAYMAYIHLCLHMLPSFPLVAAQGITVMYMYMLSRWHPRRLIEGIRYSLTMPPILLSLRLITIIITISWYITPIPHIITHIIITTILSLATRFPAPSMILQSYTARNQRLR